MIHLRTHFGGLGNRLFQLAYVYAQAKRGVNPDIYLQDTKYFEPYQDEIRALYMQGVEPIDMVSLHVRRGDYVNNPHYVDLSETDYYEEAIAQFPKDTKFLVFCADRQPISDDISDLEWCKERFTGNNFQFFQGESEVDDWNAMAGCSLGAIIANSSFSWWAAFASKKDGKKVIAPEKWFTDGVKRVSLPDSWIKI